MTTESWFETHESGAVVEVAGYGYLYQGSGIPEDWRHANLYAKAKYWSNRGCGMFADNCLAVAAKRHEELEGARRRRSARLTHKLPRLA